MEVEREEVEEESMFGWAPSGQEEVKMFLNRTWTFMSSTFDNSKKINFIPCHQQQMKIGCCVTIKQIHRHHCNPVFYISHFFLILVPVSRLIKARDLPLKQ